MNWKTPPIIGAATAAIVFAAASTQAATADAIVIAWAAGVMVAGAFVFIPIPSLSRVKRRIRRWLCAHRWGMDHSQADAVRCTRCGKEMATAEWQARRLT